MHLKYNVTANEDGRRAVDVLRHCTGMSRLMCKKVRLYGRLTRNGQAHRMIDPVFSGDVLDVYYEDNASTPVVKADAPVDILYLDEWLLVANKPASMVTHPNWMYHRGSLTDLLSDRPLHPVTRLDRNTTGAVLIALNGHAHHVITQKPMQKEYIAFVHGRFRAGRGLIQAPVKRAAASIIERVVAADGAKAMTIWQELRYYAAHDVSLMRFQLLTGRTHQIRLHCQVAGHPLLGESMYGLAATPAETELDRQIQRQALHAARLCFEHPVSGKQITIAAPLPRDMHHILKLLRR